METNLGKYISIIYRKGQIYWGKCLKEQDIASAEYPILLILLQKEGITQEAIATELDLDKSAVARSVQSLLEKGFIERKKDDIDRRCNRIYLTEKGYKSKESLQETKAGWETILAKSFTREERAEAKVLLGKVVENIKQMA